MRVAEATQSQSPEGRTEENFASNGDAAASEGETPKWDSRSTRNEARNPSTANELAKAKFIVNREGAPKPLFANVLALLSTSAEWDGVLWYDEFAGKQVLRKRPPTDRQDFVPRALKDRDVRAISEWVQFKGVYAPVNVIVEGILAFADQNRFHPVRLHLERTEWDRTPRLRAFLVDLAGVAASRLNLAMIERYMIQAVARIYDPGCQADAMLILEGPQGIGKSTFLKILFGDWYSDTLPDLGTKDAMIQLRGFWCVEIAELATLGRADTSRIKAFLTSRVDRYRSPYGRIAEDVPRQNVFAGSVNPNGTTGYLKDPTGARRFWPIRMSRSIDLAAVALIRDQLWAEAVVKYRAGHPWHLEEPELVQEQIEASSMRFDVDPWQEIVERGIDGRERIMISELLNLVSLDMSRRTQREQNRMAGILSHLGWTRRQARDPGGRSRYYYPP